MSSRSFTRWVPTALVVGGLGAVGLSLVGLPPGPLRIDAGFADSDVYLCASPGLSAAVRAAVREAGLPRRRLHEEAFAF